MDLNIFINLDLLQICFAIMKCDIDGVISMRVSLDNKKPKLSLWIFRSFSIQELQ